MLANIALMPRIICHKFNKFTFDTFIKSKERFVANNTNSLLNPPPWLRRDGGGGLFHEISSFFKIIDPPVPKDMSRRGCLLSLPFSNH